MEMWDTHVHLDQVHHLKDTVQRAINCGVTHWVLVAIGPQAYYQQSQCLKVLAPLGLRFLRSIGLHPEHPYSLNDIREVARLLEQEPIAAIGEIGLPTYRFLTRQEFNRNWDGLYIQLGWAERKNLAVIIHAVHASTEPMLRILEEFPNLHRVVFHWLKAPKEIITEIVHRQYFVGVTPDVIWRQRDQALWSLLPPSSIVLETDSPWPHHPDKSVSEPADIAELIHYLNHTFPNQRDWAWQTTLNARRLFNQELPEHPSQVNNRAM
ncbi:TatD DNase family protein [Sulfobacillus thermosulfidooxidans DSM 9293]|uniref:TatD DNase family protein n=1 Tax=Sulfobacillus thermosulfidooxidans (strain DSM 9293 / VKM B-1269 / AT-1) TaxID=929705 RepID=A0A1W1WLM8_SULTA|nr:TatD family hydrolase [Sulfobacillus thermosulfidooxidans]SMC06930.1 TatD DNase family protein [Sulfobacillus thermosulfidooxidans DSM 9293]